MHHFTLKSEISLSFHSAPVRWPPLGAVGGGARWWQQRDGSGRALLCRRSPLLVASSRLWLAEGGWLLPAGTGVCNTITNWMPEEERYWTTQSKVIH